MNVSRFDYQSSYTTYVFFEGVDNEVLDLMNAALSIDSLSYPFLSYKLC